MNQHTQLKYRVGIDVGLNSIGFCCVEVDDKDAPLRFLNLSVYRHDSGVDPNSGQSKVSRLATAGIARRTRRLYLRRRRRLTNLDNYLSAHGFPETNNEDYRDSYTPWIVRAELAQTPLRDEAELKEKLALAVRHMARHRGWRSPWVPVRSLHVAQPHSDQYLALKERVEEKTLLTLPDDATPAEIVVALDLSPLVNLRSKNRKKTDTREENKKAGFLGGKLMQSDNANELRKIAKVQGLEADLLRGLIEKVFDAESPKGAFEKLVGKDILPGQEAEDRALKAHPAFQRYRVASIVSNLRIKNPNTRVHERLEPQLQAQVIDFLLTAKPNKEITWSEVAEFIGVDRSLLVGTASQTADGERASAMPPRDVTNLAFASCKVKALKDWWSNADYDEKCEMVRVLSNSGSLTDATVAEAAVAEFLQSLSDEEHEKLDSFTLPIGRAAYSVDSLDRLYKRMIENGEDLFEARVNEFGVSDDWRPPAEPIGAQVGNPAVDRVLKAVNRYLLAAEKRWGAPLSVNIEHVREGFTSASKAVKIVAENEKRYKRNQQVREILKQTFASPELIRYADITRYLAVKRQNCACLYCGDQITFETSEIDHIVPRAGRGSTNKRDNLAAVCERCNRAKSNQPFAVWASTCGIPGVSLANAIDRVKFWNRDSFASDEEEYELRKAVIRRLKRKEEDAELNDQSIESVAWMARELAHRVDYHFRNSETQVMVFKGEVTSDARKVSGMEGKVKLIGGRGKTRLDRRHHAMDAATIALLNREIAFLIALRGNIRFKEELKREVATWKSMDYFSSWQKVKFEVWRDHMETLTDLFNDELENDTISVFSRLRLRFENSALHAANADKVKYHSVGMEWTMSEIDRASTPALWCALTRTPDFEWGVGLPKNSDRRIVVNGTHYNAGDEVVLFASDAPAVLNKAGAFKVGGALHHARVYRISGKRPKYAVIRVFSVDLHRFRKEDLFTVSLPPQTISMRCAPMKLREAIANGEAEYVGWIVPGDELELNLEGVNRGQIGELLNEYPGTYRWMFTGFDSGTQIILRPIYLSEEGLPENCSDGTRAIISGSKKGWRVSVDKVFGEYKAKVIRRDSMGNPRIKSTAHFPVTWSAGE